MQQLEVHFLPGSKTGELYEISILSDFSEYRYYTRCYADPLKYLAGTCAFAARSGYGERDRGKQPRE